MEIWKQTVVPQHAGTLEMEERKEKKGIHEKKGTRCHYKQEKNTRKTQILSLNRSTQCTTTELLSTRPTALLTTTR